MPRHSAITQEHARRRHALYGDNWAEQHRIDHDTSTWAHTHDPDTLWDIDRPCDYCGTADDPQLEHGICGECYDIIDGRWDKPKAVLKRYVRVVRHFWTPSETP